MKILLTAVNAKYIHSNPAVYSLRAFAGPYRDSVEIAEFTINQYPDDILRELYKRKPDVAAFSCYIWNLALIREVLKDLKKILPDTRIWLGGPEVSYDASEFLSAYPQAEGVMRGEGEETFFELAAHFHGKRELGEIRGITYRDGDGTIRVNPDRPVMDMNRIPFLYEDLEDFENRIIYYESSRGCPFSCSYCLSSVDKNLRFRNIETVLRELQFFLDRKVSQVKFVDRTFNCRRSHALAIWRYLHEHDNGVTNFHFEIGADLLEEEELEVLSMMRPGLVQLEIGVQSTNAQTIREIDRVMDLEHLSTVVERIRKGRNIHQHLDLIAGLPYEDHDSFRRSFADVYRLYPDQLQLGFLKVLKGSKMHRCAEQYGLSFHSEPAYEVFSSSWIGYQDILRLKAVEEMVEVYYNSGQFAVTMRYLEREFKDPFAMYAALAEYYEEQGQNGLNHSRLKRFEILRDFICTVSKDPVYDEFLLVDLYLRENSKSRPQWAADPGEYKKELAGFFKKEEEERTLLPDYRDYSARQIMHMTHTEPVSRGCLGFIRSLGYLAGKDAGDAKGETQWLLFDYRSRDPLNMNAKICHIFLE